jgi:rubrerythrin
MASESAGAGSVGNQNCTVRTSIPFVERLIGSIRREFLDQMLFWTATDLEDKLVRFQHYYNEHRTHMT